MMNTIVGKTVATIGQSSEGYPEYPEHLIITFTDGSRLVIDAISEHRDEWAGLKIELKSKKNNWEYID